MPIHRAMAALAASLTITGCASIAVTEGAIAERTATALGMDVGDFTINQRVDEGVTSRYKVTTRSGDEYSCYVTGSFGVTGRAVSEAVCSRRGEPPKNPLLRR